MNPVVRGDIVVSAFLDSVGGYRYKERRDRLLDILDVDLDWHMHAISDGERRRVQLCFGLMMPWDVLLLDEVRNHVVIAAMGLLMCLFRSRWIWMYLCEMISSNFSVMIAKPEGQPLSVSFLFSLSGLR